jgi:hypothetical protein
MRLSRRVAGAASLLLGVAAFLATASPAAAECTVVDAWPSFSEAVTTAKRIVIGKVVKPYDQPDGARRTIRFEFRVDEVLRGRSRQVIEFRHGVYSGIPLRCRDSLLRPRVGDVLALAFDARFPQYPDPVLGVAFLNRNPTRWDRFTMPNIGHVSRAQVRALAALPRAPVTDVEPRVVKPDPAVPGAPLLLIGAIGGLAFIWRLRWSTLRSPAGRS